MEPLTRGQGAGPQIIERPLWRQADIDLLELLALGGRQATPGRVKTGLPQFLAHFSGEAARRTAARRACVYLRLALSLFTSSALI